MEKTPLQEQAKRELENGLSDEELEIRKLFEGSKANNKKPKDAKLGIYKLAKYLIERHHFKTIGGMPDEVYAYNPEEGIYINDYGSATARAEIGRILGEYRNLHHNREIIETIKVSTFTKEENLIEESNELLCVNNGVLNLETGELLPHSPERFFLKKMPVDYVRDADCPTTRKFISDVFYPEDVNTLQEFVGYIIHRGTEYKKAMLLYGDFDTGKTTFSNLLLDFVGKRNYVEIKLQNLGSDKFQILNLKDKLLNVGDDLSFKNLRNTGTFKMAVDSAGFGAQKKFKQEMINFKNTAKLLFTANKIPQIPKELEDDNAYWIRWIVLSCDTVFDRKEKKSYLEMLEKMRSPEEMSGLLNWAIEGLKRLKEQGDFSFEMTAEEIRETIQRSGSNLADFVQSQTTQDVNSSITKEKFYKGYVRYCVENETTAWGKKKVGVNLRRYAPYVDGDGKENGIRVWKGISVNSDNSEETTPEQLFS